MLSALEWQLSSGQQDCQQKICNTYDSIKNGRYINIMNTDYLDRQKQQKAKSYVTDVFQKAVQNTNYRTELWTGCYAQMTLMCIPVCADIGLEVHEDTDQLIRIEQGMALVKMGDCKDRLDFQKEVCKGDTIFVPAGTWHNVINTGRMPLKVSSVYAPPHHPSGTVHRTREDAEKAHY